MSPRHCCATDIGQQQKSLRDNTLFYQDSEELLVPAEHGAYITFRDFTQRTSQGSSHTKYFGLILCFPSSWRKVPVSLSRSLSSGSALYQLTPKENPPKEVLSKVRISQNHQCRPHIDPAYIPSLFQTLMIDVFHPTGGTPPSHLSIFHSVYRESRPEDRAVTDKIPCIAPNAPAAWQSGGGIHTASAGSAA